MDGDLRTPGGVLLVSCYELGHAPAGLARPLAHFRSAGFDPRVADLSVEALDPESLAAAGFVAISVPMHTALRMGVELLRRIRAQAPAARAVFYGHYAWMNRDHLLAEGAAACLGGESEEDLVALARAWADGRPVERLETPSLRRVTPLVPDHDGLPPLDRYARVVRNGQESLVGYVEASRGCKHLCRHCPVPAVYAGRFFAVPLHAVMADVRGQVERGARHVTFGDPDFLNGPAHALRVAGALHDAFPDVTFDFTAKVSHLVGRDALLGEMRDLGCLFIVSAFESFQDDVLRYLEKGHTRRDALDVLASCRRAGITLRPTFLPFTPWAGLRDLVDLFETVEAEGIIDHVDPVQYVVRLLVPPGSLLVGHPAMQPHLGSLDPERFTYRWTHPDPSMDDLQKSFERYVDAASRSGEDGIATFARLRDMARIEAGLPLLGLPAAPPERLRAPRLTEPWFC